MAEIRVGTLNVKNTIINFEGGNPEVNRKFALYTLGKNFTAFGLQEVTKKFIENVQNELGIYTAYGDYRWGGLGYLPGFSRWNESNPVLIQGEVLENNTIKLPHELGMARIATYVLKDVEGVGPVYFINTHLSYNDDNDKKRREIQVRQLTKLEELIIKLKNKMPNARVVLSGDFNMELSNPIFVDFINELNYYGLQRVDVNGKTNAEKDPAKTAVEHIFLPKEAQIINAGLMVEPKEMGLTSHKGIYVEAELPKTKYKSR